MDGRIALDATGAPSPDAVRRFLYERGDASLGIVPMLLLDEPAADRWGSFWYAARIADDEIEDRTATAEEYVQRLRSGGSAAPDLALARFFGGLSPEAAATVRAELETALRALGRERERTGPPTMAEYACDVREKAGVPLAILNRLLLPAEDPASVRRFSVLLALSIQLGDDLRDHKRDAAKGLHVVTREELDLAASTRPLEPDPMAAIGPWREQAAAWLAILALERSERFVQPEHRADARLETLLWLRAIETGQLRDQRSPMHWPPPLGDLVAGGAPTAARMAAARRVVHHEPDILGPLQRWDARQRLLELQRVRTGLPDLYEELERAARVE